ncbi:MULTISPECIES: type II toxin-antitoxin system death-on-curing family toxin [Aerococcus]|uniref:Type II toxin-antitoxin system death-on-curing family toxin n=1 Tax=Aerococcus sanguinicola TaxID=119206 RepID=A0A5N1GUC7_9LACT|nr:MULTISPECIES: type II toxin-antitoxin system death-on-curing family toxin [Aerococcus]KAA9302190.1 type II toxin-antitoxin system death-on-curing family toxin [Aerococcus sanguinicola]MDK6368380.1 type II toxin-antitoxin system death-on-curing family toxin [Aerococcus sp. UMB9870]MDK6679462.1 type II toxin-antitoxin system death-on-curing family toxin [Aerococcus sp. UMB8608]MDK6687229.1 type II toxin-antitoxin system death-on-curing family toxin [Aerococcus sp. UMB8623]MDK6941073.1 type II
MNYIDFEFAIQIHDYVIEESGGLSGIKDPGQLESVLTHIQNDDYYPTFLDKLTHLVFSVIKFHMFIDANKRSAISLGAYFMNLNHYTYAVDNFIVEMEDVVVKVANNSIYKDELKNIIKELLE